MSKSSRGAPGVNTCAREGIPMHSRTLIQMGMLLRGRPHFSESGKGRKRAPGRCGGKTRKCESEHTALGRICTWDRRGWVRASEITLSGAARCSGRGRARGGTHSNANAHARPDYRTGFMQCTCDNYLMYHLFVKRSTCDR